MIRIHLLSIGVANTIDLGDIKKVQVKDELPVGQRLVLLAVRYAFAGKPKVNLVKGAGLPVLSVPH